jgi:hypothetical protein
MRQRRRATRTALTVMARAVAATARTVLRDRTEQTLLAVTTRCRS